LQKKQEEAVEEPKEPYSSAVARWAMECQKGIS